MKTITICLIAFSLMLPVALFGAEIGNHPCETNKCYAAFGFGFNDAFGFGSSTTTPSGGGPSSGDGFLLESADYLILESGDYLLLE